MCSCGWDLPKHFWGNGSTAELWLFFWLQRTVRQPLGASLWQTPWWFHIASEGSTAQSWLRDFTEAGFLKPSQVLQLGGTRSFSRTRRREQLHVVHFCHPFPHCGAPGPCGTGLPEVWQPWGQCLKEGTCPCVLARPSVITRMHLPVSQSSDKAVLQCCVTAEVLGSCSCWHSWSGSAAVPASDSLSLFLDRAHAVLQA